MEYPICRLRFLLGAVGLSWVVSFSPTMIPKTHKSSALGSLPLPRCVAVSPFATDMETSVEAKTLDWSFLDAAYLITCSAERRQATTEVLEEVGLADKVQVLEFATDDEDRVRGCYTSHMTTLRRACQKLTENDKQRPTWWPASWGFSDEKAVERDGVVLVLEDNLALTGRLTPTSLEEVARFVQQSDPKEWDMVHLAYTPYVPNFSIVKEVGSSSSSLVRLQSGVGSALGTTAYLIGRRGMDALLNAPQNGEAIPDVMARLFPESRYAAYPVPFVRKATAASLVNPQLDDLRKTLFRPRVYGAIETLLVTTGLSTNILLPAVIVTLCLTALASSVFSFQSISDLVEKGSGSVIDLFLPVVATTVSVSSLALVAQGIALAPKQPPKEDD